MDKPEGKQKKERGSQARARSCDRKSELSRAPRDRPMDILEEQNFYVPHLCRPRLEGRAPGVARLSGTLGLAPKGLSARVKKLGFPVVSGTNTRVCAPLSDVLKALRKEASQMRRAAPLGERKARGPRPRKSRHRFKRIARSRSYRSASQLREQGFLA
jgi:hypothetical protein